MARSLHVLINCLSVGSGGGYTVARELARHLAIARPEWRFTLCLTGGLPLHEGMRSETVPDNCIFLWAPIKTAGKLFRARWERKALRDWAVTNDVDRVVQLNGMVVPGLGVPTLCHFQDPWPYRPEAWSRRLDPFVAYLKRRAHAKALRNSSCAGFTSDYLRDLICGRLGIKPRRAETFYNGLPDDSLKRAAAPLNDRWDDRPMQLVTISNVDVYKRQALVIRAVAELVRRPALAALQYRIAGLCTPERAEELMRLADSLGVGANVHIEGRVSDARVEELYRQSRCFVLMSVCESFGIPAIEAMTFGTPVVTSDCCAMPEVCGDAADLCPTDRLPQLVTILEKSLTDSTHAQQMRELGRVQAGRFRWADSARRMADALENLTND